MKRKTITGEGKQLPVPGGYDEDGNLTTDPAAIEKSWRVLPMGYWKGRWISILLDLIATVLTDANSVQKIGTRKDDQANGIPVIEEVWEQIKAF